MERVGALSAIVLAVVGISGGAWAFGALRGEVTALKPDRIREAQEQAEQAIGDMVSAFASGVRFVPAESGLTWRQGQDARKLIPVAEGICYLTAVSGEFEGHREVVRIVERGDYWYLEGDSNQDNVRAEAACWRFPKISD